MADWGMSDPDFDPTKSKSGNSDWGLSDPDYDKGIPEPTSRAEAFPDETKSIGQKIYENLPGAKVATKSLVGQKAGFWFDRLDKQKQMQDAIAQGTYIAPIQQEQINKQAEEARQKLPELLAEYAQVNADIEVESASGEKKTIGQLYKEGDYGTLLSQFGKEYLVEPLVAGAPQIAATIAGGPVAPLTGGAYGAADAYSNTILEETIKRGGDPKNLDNLVEVFEANRDEIMSTAEKKTAIGGGFGALFGAGPGSRSVKQFFGNLLGFYAPVGTLQAAAEREVTQVPVVNPETGEPVVGPDGKVLMEDLPPMTLGETADVYAKGVVAGLPFGLAKVRMPERVAAEKPQAPEVPPTLPPFRGQGPETPPPSAPAGGRAPETAPAPRAKPADLDAAAILKADGWSIDEIALMSPRQQQTKANKAVKERNVKPAALTPDEINALSPVEEAPVSPPSPARTVEAQGPEGVSPPPSAPPAAPRRQAPSEIATKLVEEGVPPLQAMQRAAAETAAAPTPVALAEPAPEVAMPQAPARVAKAPITVEQIKPYLPTDAAGNPNYGALQQKIVEIAGPDKFLKDLTPEQGGRLLTDFGVPVEAEAPVAEAKPKKTKPTKIQPTLETEAPTVGTEAATVETQTPSATFEEVKGNTYGSMNPNRFMNMVFNIPNFANSVQGKTPAEAGNGKIKVRVDPKLIPQGRKIEDAVAALPAAVKEVIVLKDAYKGLSQKQVGELNKALKKIEDAGGKVTLEGEPPTFEKKKRTRPTSELGSFIASIGGIKGTDDQGRPDKELKNVRDRKMPGLVRKDTGMDLWAALNNAVAQGFYPEYRGEINETRDYGDVRQKEMLDRFVSDLEKGGVYQGGKTATEERKASLLKEEEDRYAEIEATLRTDLRAFGIEEHPDVVATAIQILERGEAKDSYDAYELAYLEELMEDPSIAEPVIHDITGEEYWAGVEEQRIPSEGEALPAEYEPMEAALAYETGPSPAPENRAIRGEGSKREEKPAAKAKAEEPSPRREKPVGGEAEGRLTIEEVQKMLDAKLRPGYRVAPSARPADEGKGVLIYSPDLKKPSFHLIEDIPAWIKGVIRIDPTQALKAWEVPFTPVSGLDIFQNVLNEKLGPEYKIKYIKDELHIVTPEKKNIKLDKIGFMGGGKKEFAKSVDAYKASLEGKPEAKEKGAEGPITLVKQDVKKEGVREIADLELSNGERFTINRYRATAVSSWGDWEYNYYGRKGDIDLGLGEDNEIGKTLDDAIAKILEIRNKGLKPKAPVEERGAEGKPQLVVPGAEKISDKELAERKAEAPMRAKVEQKEAGGLFGEDHLQNELKFMQQLKDEGKIVGYHGTTDIVERFASDKTKLKRGIFFSKSPDLANRFADRTAIGEDPLKYRGDFPDEEVIAFVDEVLGSDEANKAARLIEQYDAAARRDDVLEEAGVSWDSPERSALRSEYNGASRMLNKILMTASSMVEGKPNVTKVIIKPGKVYNYSFEKEFDWAEEERAIKFARDNGYDTVKFNLPNSRFGDDEFYSVLDEKSIEPFYSKRYAPPAIQVFSPQEQDTAKELYKQFEGIVRRTIGEKAAVKFVKSIQTGMESKLAAGAYDRVSNAIYLATDLEKGASLEDAVYHEAWHVVEDLLAPKELEALDRYRAVTNKKVAEFYKVPVENIEALPKTEQDAYAMGMFGAMKDAGLKFGQGALPTPVYETLQKSYLTFLRFRNAVKKTVGMRDPDTIFTDFYLGNMRDRLIERTDDMADSLGFDQSVQYQTMRRRRQQGPQMWAVPRETVGAELMHNFVDKYYDWTRVQRAMEAARGAPLTEPLDVEMSIQLMQDKAIAKQNKTWEEEVVDMLAELQANKITAKEFGLFLYAQHAKERNARMFARDPSRFNGDNGSGMTNVEADQYMASLTPAKRSTMRQIYQDHIKKIIQADLDYRLDNDLLTQEQYDNLILPYNQGGYDYYVPLTGFAEDEADATNDIPNVGRGFAVWGKEYKVAFGRNSLAMNPLFSVIQRRMDGITRVEKNNTNMTVYRLIKDNPNPEFASIYAPNNLPKRPVLRADGTVQYIPDFAEARSEYTLPLKIGGQPFYIVFNRESEAAARLVRQMKNLAGENPGIAMRGVLAMGRYMSKINTQWVPDFFLANFPRDIQDALLTIYSTREGFTTNFIKDFTYAGNIIRKVAMNKSLSGDEQKYYNEWLEHGGRVDFGGFSTLAKTQEKISDDFASLLDGQKTTAQQVTRYLKKTGDLTLGTIEKVNQVFDDAVRLAVYIAARRDPNNQFTPDRAAQLARNSTVDFRVKGDKMPILNAMKPFLSVGITGARNLSRIMRSKRGLRGLAYVILFGVMTSILGYILSEDDENDPTKKKYFTKVNDWERAKSIVIPFPINGEYKKINLGFYGLIAFGLGDQMVGVATGNIKPTDAAINIGASILASFVPFYGGDMVNAVLPWFVSPVVQSVTNRDWLGNPLYPDQKTNMPQSSQAFEKTPEWAKSVAQFMNRLTWGTYTEPGYVDVYPATLSNIFNLFGGATSTFASSSFENFRKFMDGEAVKSMDLPFVRRLSTKDTADRTAYYDIRNEINESVAQARAAQKIVKDPKMDEQKKADARQTMRRLTKELGITFTSEGISTKYSIVEKFDKADERIKVFNDRIKKIQESDMTGEQKSAIIEGLEASKKQVMDAARRRYIRKNPSPQSPIEAIEEMLQ